MSSNFRTSSSVSSPEGQTGTRLSGQACVYEVSKDAGPDSSKPLEMVQAGTAANFRTFQGVYEVLSGKK